MNISLTLNRDRDAGVSSQSAHITTTNEPYCLVLNQKFDCENVRHKVILDMEQANALREWLNKNLPR